MSKLMTWLQRRPSGQYRVRVTIPPRLRRFFNDRTILTKVLGTSDPQVAKRKAVPVMAELQRQLQEAEAALANPAVAAYRAVQEVQASNLSDDQAEALDSYLTTKLEDDDRDERGEPSASYQRKLAGVDDGTQASLAAVVGGDVTVRSITKALFRAYKDSLVRTPTRHGNSATLSPASVTKGLGAIRSVLAWAVGQGYPEVNPADGIRHAGARREHRVSRRPYDADDLRKIFGQQRTAGADTWLPLLGLWTGARLEELGGLRVEDVKDNDTVPHLFIRGTDQRRLKNKGSERRVSLHPALTRSGFLAYVQERRAAGDVMLFPELRADAHSKLTRMWGKKFARHVRLVCGVTDKRKAPMHSFRHAWIDAARAVMIEEHRHTITGHSGGGVGRMYGTSVPLSVLAESMARVRFEGMES
jgi:integrase